MLLQCVLCAAAVQSAALCDGCRADIARLRLKNPCRLCGFPQTSSVADTETEAVCSRCSGKPPPLDGVFVRYAYLPPLENLVLRFKYGGQWQLAKTLAQFIPAPPPTDFVVPVPLHYRRERWRGFNQARELAKRLNLSPTAHLLTRTLDTPPQASLDGSAARRRNILGAFRANPPPAPSGLRGKSILLVDDVMTSGATLFEAARTLKKAGAATVYALITARTVF